MNWLKVAIGVATLGAAVVATIAVVKWSKKKLAEKARAVAEERSYKNAFKAKILEANEKAISVGVFSAANESLGSFTVEGELDDVKIGEEILLYS